MFTLRKTGFVAHVKQESKLVPTIHTRNIMTTDRPLELLHMDLFGPIAYISIGGLKYYLVIVDDYSCLTWYSFYRKNLRPKRL
jgi:hypothetical protein